MNRVGCRHSRLARLGESVSRKERNKPELERCMRRLCGNIEEWKLLAPRRMIDMVGLRCIGTMSNGCVRGRRRYLPLVVLARLVVSDRGDRICLVGISAVNIRGDTPLSRTPR
jgi:hypothetical protein